MKLYRGFDFPISEGPHPNIFAETPRRPKATSPPVHQIADDWFFANFNVRARSSTIICSTCIEQAKSYAKGGVVAEITPLPPYKLIYSPRVSDMLGIVIEVTEYSKEAVGTWLANNNYQMTISQEMLPKDFRGEVMVCCSSFIVKHVDGEQIS